MSTEGVTSVYQGFLKAQIPSKPTRGVLEFWS